MPDLSFHITSAARGIVLQIKIANRPPEQRIHGIRLHCQVQIETARRRYSEPEQLRLRARFGERFRPIHWANITVEVPAFTGSTTIELRLPCTNAEYFEALESGAVPLILFFSGSVFYEAPPRPIQFAPVPWTAEARFNLPVELWKQTVEAAV